MTLRVPAAHPHPLGKPLKNRKPRKAEIEAGAVYGRRLIDIVQPRIVVAIGRVAESSLDKSGPYGVHYVRHPANGGAAKFKDDMRRLLG
jgi:uracil-DNA glycosylase family 4